MYKVIYDYTDELGNKNTLEEDATTDVEANETRQSLMECDDYSNIQIINISVD